MSEKLINYPLKTIICSLNELYIFELSNCNLVRNCKKIIALHSLQSIS